MTIEEQRKAIIEDASRKEFEAAFPMPARVKYSARQNKYVPDGNATGEDFDIAGIYEARWQTWQAARNQSNKVPVAWRYDEKTWAKDTYTSIYSEAPPEQNPELTKRCVNVTPLYTSPQQSNALEMAADKSDIVNILHDYKNLAGNLRDFHREQKLQQAIDEIVKLRALIPQPESTAPQQAIPSGYALVPHRLTKAMNRVLSEEDWQWEDLLAAANAITEEEYQAISTASPIERDK
jgi:hypothetical protein